MDAAERRNEIEAILAQTKEPVSASRLAQRLGVSRQVIVGDIALLRAAGRGIIATARGYMVPPVALPRRYVGKVACQHTPQQMEQELLIIVQQGGEVLDVVVAHELYGEITGQLNLATAEDVQGFVRQMARSHTKPLSDLTAGVHLHTLACRDAAVFAAITARLAEQGLLYIAN